MGQQGNDGGGVEERMSGAISLLRRNHIHTCLKVVALSSPRSRLQSTIVKSAANHVAPQPR